MTSDYVLLDIRPERAGRAPGADTGHGCPGLPGVGSGSRPVLAIGVFDGVHVGHQSLLRNALQMAGGLGAPLWVLTFWPHPEDLLAGAGKDGRSYLATLEDKVRLLKSAGADEIVVLHFTRRTADIAPEDFVKGTLARRLAPRAVVVGFNFTFGRRGRGTPGLLRDLGTAVGIEVVVHPAVKLDGEVVSSSSVRASVQRGDLQRAGLLLGRPYSLAGPVERGAGRGRGLGFPTLNVAVPDRVIYPAGGVYACAFHDSADAVLALAPGSWRPAVANVGTAPTFTASDPDAPVKVEVHMLSGEPPSRGDPVRVSFMRRLRPETRFSGPEELRSQIARDCDEARRYFRTMGA